MDRAGEAAGGGLDVGQRHVQRSIDLGVGIDLGHAGEYGTRYPPGRLYRRSGEAVGYGYHPIRPAWGGPYAAVDPADLPVLLADGETAAAAAGHETVTFDLALTARGAWRHVLDRGLRIDPFVMLLFTDGPIDGLEGYCLTSPPFFL